MRNLINGFIFVVMSLFAGIVVADDGNKATKLLKTLHERVGGWDLLAEQKDVEYKYIYSYADGKQDISIERYIFDGEHSWAKYTKHEINVLPGQDGDVIQSYVFNKPSISLNGKTLDDQQAIGVSEFLRRANYFWLTMNFKLTDQGAIHKNIGKEIVNSIEYDKVGVTYDSEKVGKEVNDGYILYINPNTGLVDQFLFSLPAFNVFEPVLKMVVEYDEVNGLILPLKRKIYQPDGQGGYGIEPAIVQESLNVKFKNGFTPDSFKS
jgi:hypothetical protein